MKLLKNIEFGNPFLRKKAKKVSLKFLKTVQGKNLIENMIFTMRKNNGVGLAAPQIGKSWQLVVMEIRSTPTRPNQKPYGPIIVANPKIINYSKKIVDGWEGCTSIKGIFARVPRSKSVTVEYYNEKGKKIIKNSTDFLARIFQHEIDHLNGIGFMDRVVDNRTFITASEFKKIIAKRK